MFAFILDTIVSNHVSVVDNLVSKYGQGESHLQNCPTCEYEELKTSGVYVSEGGAVIVYAADDQFSCPDCSSGKNDQAETFGMSTYVDIIIMLIPLCTRLLQFLSTYPCQRTPFFGPLP